MPSLLRLSLTASLFALFSAPAHAEDYTIILKDHQFSPAELTIPAGRKVKLTVKNASDVPAEFESSDLNREKIITPQSEITVFIGPLDAGRYTYFDDFHRASTGHIAAK